MGSINIVFALTGEIEAPSVMELLRAENHRTKTSVGLRWLSVGYSGANRHEGAPAHREGKLGSLP